MSKYTKGPWVTGKEYNGIRYYVNGNTNKSGNKICSVVSLSDAKLIAAAPEMLEALKMAHNCIVGSEHPKASATIEVIDELLGKIEGVK